MTLGSVVLLCCFFFIKVWDLIFYPERSKEKRGLSYFKIVAISSYFSSDVEDAVILQKVPYLKTCIFSHCWSATVISQSSGSWERRESSSQLITSEHCCSMKTNVIILLLYAGDLSVEDYGDLKRQLMQRCWKTWWGEGEAYPYAVLFCSMSMYYICNN